MGWFNSPARDIQLMDELTQWSYVDVKKAEEKAPHPVALYLDGAKGKTFPPQSLPCETNLKERAEPAQTVLPTPSLLCQSRRPYGMKGIERSRMARMHYLSILHTPDVIQKHKKCLFHTTTTLSTIFPPKKGSEILDEN